MTSKIQKHVIVSQALLIFVAYLFKRDTFSSQSVMLMRKNGYNGASMTDVIYSKPCANQLFFINWFATLEEHYTAVSRTSIIGKSLTTQDRGVIELLS